MSAPDVFELSGQALAEHPEIGKLSAALQAPQAALRARLNAVVLDLILLGVWAQVMGLILWGRGTGGKRLGLFLVLEFAYFFTLELATGQTIGKRVFGVRVTTADGSRATAGQIALRNVLRIADALPFFYVSGLVSLARTGPGRRQRIGDVAARTTVVLEPGARAPRTPDWLLPAATLITTLLSLAIIIPVLSAGGRAGPGAIATAGPGDTPLEGRWSASRRIISSVGYNLEGAPTVVWTIAHGPCRPGSLCGLSLSYAAGDGRTFTAALTRTPQAWLATFPPLTFPCAQDGGRTIYWSESKVIALRFTDGGQAAEGEERDRSSAPECGYGEAFLAWHATRLGG